MANENEIIEDKIFDNTFLIKGKTTTEIPKLLVNMYPLTQGDYEKLISVDKYENWVNYFIGASIAYAITVLGKIISFLFNKDIKSEPELWEWISIIVPLILMCIVKGCSHFWPSSKKKLKKRIVDVLNLK